MTARAVRWAMEVGYRLVDTAACYRNEADVGRAIRESGNGAELFVTTKIWADAHGSVEEVLGAVSSSLAKLQVQAVDLILIHSPMGGNLLEVWDGLLEARRRGWARSVGVSNFNVSHLKALVNAGRPLPVVNQIECNCFRQQRELREWCLAAGVVVMAHAPLAKGKKLQDHRLQCIATRHGKTTAQVMLRWVLQEGLVAIPKSVKQTRIAENKGVFDFVLDKCDMEALGALEEDLRCSWEDMDPLGMSFAPGCVEALCNRCCMVGETGGLTPGQLQERMSEWLCRGCLEDGERRSSATWTHQKAAWVVDGSLPWESGPLPKPMLSRIAAALSAARPAQKDVEGAPLVVSTSRREGPACKGDVLFERAPRLFVQTIASRRRCLICGHCGALCGSAAQQLSAARGQRRRGAIEHPGHALPDLPGVAATACCPCEARGCEEAFCGEPCRAAAHTRGAHAALCRGRSRNVRELLHHAVEAGDEKILLVDKLVAQVAQASTLEKDAITMGAQLDLLGELLGREGEVCNGHGVLEAPEAVEEHRLLLELVLVHDLGWLSDRGMQDLLPGDCEQAQRAARLARRALSRAGYGRLVRRLEQASLRLELPSPLARYCQELLQAPSELLVPCLAALGPFVTAAISGDAECQLEEGSSAAVNVVERHAARLAQAAEAALWGGENPFAAVGGAVVALMPVPFEHSCVPNTSLEAGAGEGGLRVQLVASRDIASGEPLTVAHVGIDVALAQRSAALRARFGSTFTCDCARCRSDDYGCGEAGLNVEQLRLLGDFAMQGARHSEAFRLYGEVLKLIPDDGDAWHARGTALYESGRWAQGNAVFLEGAALAPQHVRLGAEAAKIRAYRWHPLDGTHLALTLPSWSSYLRTAQAPLGRCFLTTGPLPVLAPAECAAAIESAEAFSAAQGGWTTVRHYAVPTTDLNIHEVPALHGWFLEVMHRRLAPLLAAQFGSQAMGDGGASVCVGDAFLVKYTAMGGTKHIPVHRDYSTHSLTIALNPSTEYAGGGTYFCELGQSLRPELGHVVSFSGDLVHGGDPITHGTRYIVAAFLYVDDVPEGLSHEAAGKRRRTLEASARTVVDHARLKAARMSSALVAEGPAGSPPGGPGASGASGATSASCETESWLQSLAFGSE